MSDSQVIRFAKAQDKKYFDVSAKEASIAMNNQHYGFNNDLEAAITMPQFSLLKRVTR